MALNPEWKDRVDTWRRELKEHFYVPLEAVEFGGFATREQLSPEQADKGRFKPMPVGAAWGAKWEYAWFQAELTLPASAVGQRVVLRPDVGAESLVFINGKAAGARDKAHTELLLSLKAKAGEKFHILIEGYGGHGPTPVSCGPQPPGRVTVPEPPATQRTVGQSSFGIWQEEAYQLWIDVETLYQVRGNIDPNLLRVSEIDQGLRDFTTIVDFELPADQMLATFKAARKRLGPLLACVNGSTAPTLYTFGHAHLDVAWLWPLAETERKAARTFSNQLALMEQYPQYKFLQSEPHLYWMVKTLYPELYQRIKKAVKAGKVIADGGMWIEADTNLSSGESLIRQFIHGKRFFREEFGVENEIMWLPDVFGYSGTLPQIMHGCGINYFATAKIFWAYHGGEQFPYNTFWWEGIDGTQVMVNLCNDYSSPTDPASVIRRWNERVQRDGISTRLMPFGHGDGGGGPTRDHLEYLRRLENLEGVPQTKMAAPIEYFKDQEARGWPSEKYVGELYFQAHRGTYTSQAKTKKANRRSEFAVREAELWGSVARALKGLPYPAKEMEEVWRGVLLNQFHDIIPGSSIARVYEEALALYDKVIAKSTEVADAARAKLAGPGEGLAVFNSLTWGRTALVPLPKGANSAADAAGESLPAQAIDGVTYVEAAVPGCGWTTLSLSPTADKPAKSELKVSAKQLENDLLRVQFNKAGEIVSLFDKSAKRELAAGLCNSFRMYRDVPSQWDAWDIDSIYELTPVEMNTPATIEVLASGPLLAKIRVKRQLHLSTMTQDIVLRRGSRRVDFVTTIDWKESHKLLKVNFPVNVHANEAVHEIQFGHIRRPNHRSRVSDQDRYEVCNHRWSALVEEGRGVAILNDSKYGLNVLDNSINLTLLKSGLAPDMTADKGVQEFTYSFYAWDGCLADSEVVKEGYELNCPVTTARGQAGQGTLFTLDAANIVIETVKPAEDGSKDVVLRLYEAKHTATRCTLTTSLPAMTAQQTNMLEEHQSDLPLNAGKLALNFRPFEVKTIRLRMGKK